MKIAIKRVYEPYEESDGYRVLVDRLWPRGLTKAGCTTMRAKSLRPQPSGRPRPRPIPWATFQEKYVAELDANPEALKFAKKLSSPEMAKYPRVTLIYAARDEKENEAVVLQKWLPAHE